VTTWEAQDALTVPVGALFRRGDAWAVFTIVNGRVRTVPIEAGQRNNRVAEVVSGLSTGDRVVLHPSDRVKEGVAVAERENRLPDVIRVVASVLDQPPCNAVNSRIRSRRCGDRPSAAGPASCRR